MQWELIFWLGKPHKSKEIVIRLLFARRPVAGFRLFVLSVLSILLMIGDHHQSRIVTKIREGFSYVALPVIYFSHIPFYVFDTIATHVQSHEVLLNENATLRASVLLLQGKLQRLEALQSENKELKSLLQSSAVTQHLKLMLAQVTALQLSPYTQEIMLNKGSKSGVFVGQAVLDADGIMGQVIEVSPYTSRVLLITDPKSGIPVQDMRTGLHGILIGQEKTGLLLWQNVSPNSDIKVGDKLISSGLGGRFPIGYPVGEVIRVNAHTSDQFMQIDIEPCAKINSSEHVLLVWSAST